MRRHVGERHARIRVHAGRQRAELAGVLARADGDQHADRKLRQLVERGTVDAHLPRAEGDVHERAVVAAPPVGQPPRPRLGLAEPLEGDRRRRVLEHLGDQRQPAAGEDPRRRRGRAPGPVPRAGRRAWGPRPRRRPAPACRSPPRCAPPAGRRARPPARPRTRPSRARSGAAATARRPPGSPRRRRAGLPRLRLQRPAVQPRRAHLRLAAALDGDHGHVPCAPERVGEGPHRREVAVHPAWS